jgi:hypothetical protein
VKIHKRKNDAAQVSQDLWYIYLSNFEIPISSVMCVQVRHIVVPYL